MIEQMEILWLHNQVMTLKDQHEAEIAKLQERIAELEKELKNATASSTQST